MERENLLKYYKIIRIWLLNKYNITGNELDMLVFLSDEGFFTLKKYYQWNNIFSWKKDRLDVLIEKGLVEFVNKHENPPKTKAVYRLTLKGRAIVNLLYKKLNGEEISIKGQANPFFRGKLPFSHKVYGIMIRQMRDETRELKRKKRSEGNS